MFNLKSVKTQLIIFLITFALFIALKDRGPAFLLSCSIALFSAAAIDAIAGYYKNRKILISESSIISGLIIGFVLSADEPWWKFVAAAGLAILSKHLIRFKDRHIFNPAAFGIFLSTIFLSAQTQWKGTYLWYILVPFGLYFAQKIRKTGIIIAYLLSSFILFGSQTLLHKAPLWNVFGYLSYFYIFVMAIEPKTTPFVGRAKLIFGALLAALVFVLTQTGAHFDVELAGLLAMNAAVPMLNKIIGGAS